MRRLPILAAALALTVGCSKPPETFEAEGIRLHDGKVKCDADYRTALLDGTAKTPHLMDAFYARCLPVWDANNAHIAKAKQLRADGVIR